MTSKPNTLRRASVVLFAAALGLSACTEAEVARILADGGEEFPTDFVGQTFPVYFATGEVPSGRSARTDAGIGSARFISETEIEAKIPGQPTRIYTRVGMTNEWDPGDGGFSLFITDLGAMILADNIDVDGFSGGVVAYSGFETPVDSRPPTARYNDGSFGVLFVSDDTEPDAILTMECFDCVDLEANFGTGAISGQVFDGTTDIDDGSLRVVNTLTGGSITETGYTGDIDVELSLTDGGGTTTASATTSNQDVTGRFFGESAERTAVVYESDFSVGIGDDTFNGSIAGASDASDGSLFPPD